jgi:large subunit ribosomal protein L31
MKAKIHPKWYPDAKVKCACGNTFSVGATVPQIEVEICAACHPFFTGEMKYVDTMGRVEKFQKKQRQASGQAKKKKKARDDKKQVRPQTLKEMFKQAS